jgi:hypothetical protein
MLDLLLSHDNFMNSNLGVGTSLVSRKLVTVLQYSRLSSSEESDRKAKLKVAGPGKVFK